MEGRDRTDQIKQVQTALAGMDEAQRLTGKLDQNANSRAGDVAKIIADVWTPWLSHDSNLTGRAQWVRHGMLCG